MAGAMAPIIVALAGAVSMHLAAGEVLLPSEDDWSLSGDRISAAAITQPAQRQALLGEEAFEVSKLQSWGVEVADMDTNEQGGQQTDFAYFATVCERTRKALFATVPDSPSPNKLLGGPVYGECTSALAAERRGSADGDAVSVLHDCMALIDALVSKLSSKPGNANVCSDLAAALHVAGSQPTVLAVPPVAQSRSSSAPATPGQSSVQGPALPDARASAALIPKTQMPMTQAAATLVSQGGLRTETMQIGLVAGHMTDICIETVQAVEAGIKSETDALELANVTAACEGAAQKSLGSFVALTGTMTQSLHGWCSELDGRLMLALEAGFLFALEPDDAQRQAGRTNPYAMATRRQFCDRFTASVQRDLLQSSRSFETSAQNSAVTQQPHMAAVMPAATSRQPAAAATPQLPQQVVKPQPPQVPATSNLQGIEDTSRQPAAAATQQLPQQVVKPQPPQVPATSNLQGIEDTSRQPAAAATQQLPQQVVKPQPPQVPATSNLRGSEDRGRNAGAASVKPAHASVATRASYPTETPVAQSTHAASAGPPALELHAKVPQVASRSTEEHQVQDSAGSKTGGGMEMFRLVQSLSAKPDWSSTCVDLLVGLAAKEGSITDADALTKPAVDSGVEVLTFNAADQSNIGRCASRLEDVAGKLGILSLLSMKSDTADDKAAAQKAQQTFIKSPWAFDACSDVAHAFLTMELAHPGTRPRQFCQLYTKKLQTMKGARNDASVDRSQRARDDVARLKQRARERAMRGMSHAVVAKMQSHKADAILAVVKPAESNIALSLPLNNGTAAKVPQSTYSAAAVGEAAPLAGVETPVQAASLDAGDHEGQGSVNKTSATTAKVESGVAAGTSDNASMDAVASDSGVASNSTNQDDQVAAAFWSGQLEG